LVSPVSFFTAQIDLILQISILVFLTVGLAVERNRKIKAHASLMLVAVVLNLIFFSSNYGTLMGQCGGRRLGWFVEYWDGAWRLVG
jgi:uncharacterized membrane protein YozB (DUF420 family)